MLVVSIWASGVIVKKKKKKNIYPICTASACTTETNLDSISFTYECSNNNNNNQKSLVTAQTNCRAFVVSSNLLYCTIPVFGESQTSNHYLHTTHKHEVKIPTKAAVAGCSKDKNISSVFWVGDLCNHFLHYTTHRHEVKISTNHAVAGGWKEGGEKHSLLDRHRGHLQMLGSMSCQQLACDSNGLVFSVYTVFVWTSDHYLQTPCTCLQHPSSNRCHNGLCHRSPKNC